MFKILKKFKLRLLFFSLFSLLLLSFYILSGFFFTNIKEFIDKYYLNYAIYLLIILLPILYNVSLFASIEHEGRRNYVVISNSLTADFEEAFEFSQTGVLIYNRELEILWASNLFYERKIEIVGKHVSNISTKLSHIIKNNQAEELTLEIGPRTYIVKHINELKMLIFKDITDLTYLQHLSNENQPILATVLLDNINSILTLISDEKYEIIEAEIHKAILNYAEKYKILIKRIKDNSYILILNEKIFGQLVEDNFSLLDDVLECNKDIGIKLTISIGFGRGSNDYNLLNTLSNDAINVAQTRGGNQVVVSNFAGHLDFYGSSNEGRVGINAIENRTRSQTIISQLKSYETILLVPHENADFDAIGACLGMYSLAKQLEKEAYIVAEEKQIEVKARKMFNDLFDNSILISPQKALTLQTNTTLVVVLDVHRATLTTSYELLNKSKNIIVIDHHRRAEDAIGETIYSYIEPNASSASELVTQIISSSTTKIELNPKVATYLMSGLLLDTRGFKTRTSSSTFDAARKLKDYGADNKVASSYLKQEYEEFILKSSAMSAIKITHYGIAVTKIPEKQIVDRTSLAIIAEEIIDVSGIKAAFVIGKTKKDEIAISGRSDGTINVQLIMEKLGGGGHYGEGACQLKIGEQVEDIEGALNKLNLVIDDYEDVLERE